MMPGRRSPGKTSRQRAAGPGTEGASRTGILGAVVLLSVVAFVIFQSFGLDTHTCEVCMSFDGRTKCRTVGGSTVETARMAAITNACAFLASGMQDSMACGRQQPLRENCR